MTEYLTDDEVMAQFTEQTGPDTYAVYNRSGQCVSDTVKAADVLRVAKMTMNSSRCLHPLWTR